MFMDAFDDTPAAVVGGAEAAFAFATGADVGGVAFAGGAAAGGGEARGATPPKASRGLPQAEPPSLAFAGLFTASAFGEPFMAQLSS